MYERLLNKDIPPTPNEILQHIGAESNSLLIALEKLLCERYSIIKELKFPFGNSYGWGFKYSHKTKHLCYVFFEKNAISVTVQIGNNDVSKLNEQLDTFLPKTRKLWATRYPCGNGGWIHYRVISNDELMDILSLIAIKKKPVNL